MTKRPGPSENDEKFPADDDAQDAIEATQGAARWERKQVQREGSRA